MRTLTFASIKGGVGKTTLAAHVAAGLAEAGQRTLLLDLDPQGHATAMLGIEMGADAPCVADAFGARPRSSLANLLRPSSKLANLQVAPANGRMVGLERDLYRWGHRLQAITRGLQTLPDAFDAVVIDTPPQLNAFSEAALYSCDLLIVPVPAMAHALQGLDEINAAFGEVNEGRRSKAMAVVNLWDRRTAATNAAMEEALADLPVALAETRVPRGEVLNQAALAFELVYAYAPGTEVEQALRALTTELWRAAQP